VLVAAAAELVGVPPAGPVPLASVGCALLLSWRVWATARGPLGLSAGASLMGVAFLALSPAIAAWSSSGLETMPAALLLFLTFEALFLWKRADAWAWGALLAVGVSLIRAEGFTWALLLSAVSRHRLRTLPLVGLAVAAQFGLRKLYFGQWVPNTVTAKVGFSAPVLARGLRYFASVQLTLLTPLLALAGSAALLRRLPDRIAQVGAGLLLLGGLCWPVLVGGDFMPMGRLFVSVLPFLALAWAAGLASAPRPAQLVAVGALLLGVLPAFDLHLVPEPARAALNYRLGKPYRSEHRAWEMERDQVTVLRTVGRALKAHTPPGATVVAGAIGVLGYESDREILDRYGLVTPEVARREIVPSALGMPGHDKAVEVFYFAKDQPDVLFAAMMPNDALQERTRPFAQDLFKRGLQSQYAPALLPHEGQWLFVLRRIRAGEDPAVVWEAYTEAVGMEGAVQRGG